MDQFHLSDRLIDEIVELLDNGGVIGYPTETVYGLGGDATNEKVIRRIHVLKGRATNKPMLVLVGRVEQVLPLVYEIPDHAKPLVESCWPGPLTMIFKASPKLSEWLVSKDQKIGIRISSDPFCRRLLEIFQKPLVSTSANPSGKKPAQSALEVKAYFGRALNLIVDGGERNNPKTSTILDITQYPPLFIREGAFSREHIRNRMEIVDEKEE